MRYDLNFIFNKFFQIFASITINTILSKSNFIWKPIKYISETKTSNLKSYFLLNIFKEWHIDVWDANFSENIGFFSFASF